MQKEQPQAEGLLLRHKALQVLLSHQSICNSQQLLAKLLLTSKVLAEAVSEQLIGSAAVRYQILGPATLESVPGLADWIGRRGHILKACAISLSIDTLSARLAERALALGFTDAAQSPKGLHLQSYVHHGGTESVRHILSQLPPRHLQHLHLCVDEDVADMRPVMPALAALTSLTSITLRSGGVEQVLPALHALTCLRVLQLSTLGEVASMGQLPPSIETMHLSMLEEDEDSEPSQQRCSQLVQLGHLTQCTCLSSNTSPLPLHSALDVLPPNLHDLHVELCCNEATVPLRGLSCLTGLTLLEPRVDAQQHLEALASSLTALQCLRIGFRGALVTFNTGGWAGLPVHSLHVDMPSDSSNALVVPAAAVAGLTNLASSLTELSLTGAHCDACCTVVGSPLSLAEVLQQLTGLKRLVLTNLDFDVDGAEVRVAAWFSMERLVARIANLPHLIDLGLNLPHIISPVTHPAAQLAAAKGLTHLTLSRFGVNDFALLAVISELSELCRLDVSGNPITNASMPAIAALLPALTFLGLAETHVTDEGLAYLSKLRRLRDLSVPDGVSEEAVRKALNWDGSVVISEDGAVDLRS